MKKTMSVIAFFAVVVISLSAHTERVHEAAEGYVAPQFSISYGDSLAFSLADTRGHYTLLNFWSSDDPASRIAANEYTAFSRAADATQFSLVSVNTDTSRSLFDQIKRRDRLDDATQYHLESTQSRKVIDAYNMRHRLRSFLLDPQGMVIAVEPDRALLESKFGR